MNEKEFKRKLILLVFALREDNLNFQEFKEQATDLASQVEKTQIDSFNDKVLGWAKYWIEEMEYYGAEEVIQNKFDFSLLLKEQE